MNGPEFYAKVKDHSRLEWLGAKEATKRTKYQTKSGTFFVSALPDRVYVLDRELGNKHELPITEILTKPWDQLEAVLTSSRRAEIMVKITRVVGYYSQINNWNRSKLEELKDRGNGNYTVPDKMPDLDGDTPKEVMSILAEGGANMSCDIGGGK